VVLDVAPRGLKSYLPPFRDESAEDGAPGNLASSGRQDLFRRDLCEIGMDHFSVDNGHQQLPLL
jgi:hypothetical protein